MRASRRTTTLSIILLALLCDLPSPAEMRARPPTVAEIVGKHPQAFIGRAYRADPGDEPLSFAPPGGSLFNSPPPCIGKIRVHVERVLINRTSEPLFNGGTVTIAFDWPGPLSGMKPADFLGKQLLWVTGYPPGNTPVQASLQRHVGWSDVKHEAAVIDMISKRNSTSSGVGVSCVPAKSEWNGLLVVVGAMVFVLAAGIPLLSAYRRRSDGLLALRDSKRE